MRGNERLAEQKVIDSDIRSLIPSGEISGERGVRAVGSEPSLTVMNHDELGPKDLEAFELGE